MGGIIYKRCAGCKRVHSRDGGAWGGGVSRECVTKGE